MLSVVIPTLNRPDSLIRLVGSLQQLIVSPETCEVLVVYNNEQDKKNSPLKSRSNLQLLCAPKPGVNHARNHGVLHAKGEVILFLDDDCEVVESAFLQKHLDYHKIHPQLMAIGGPYLLKQQATLWDQIYHHNNVNWIEANRTDRSHSTALLGGNTSYKASLFQKGFRFTEEIIYGGSETPLNTILALKYGPHGYFLDLAVLHNTHLNFWSLFRKAYLQGIGAALQTKMYGHSLMQVAPVSLDTPFSLRAGLELYSILFAVGYRSQFSQKNLLLVFINTAFVRLTTPLLMSIQGFIISLSEPLPSVSQTNLAQRFSDRSVHIARKFAWLFLKTVGLR